MGLKGNVLVLNQDFSPLTVCDVERAFILVYLNKAELVSKSEINKIRTISETFPHPSVVRLNRYIRVPYKDVVLSRYNVFRRDNFECQYCGTKASLTLDHVIPKSKGGDSSWKNLITACSKCNNKKGNMTPKQAGLILRSVPKKPNLSHFLREFSDRSNKDWEPFLRVTA